MKKRISRKLFTLFLSFLMVLSVLMTAGTQIVFAANWEDVVPDMNLRSYINGNLFDKYDDDNIHDPISKAQMETLPESLWIGYVGDIQTLEGIQYATNLIELTIDESNVPNIEQLEKLINLEDLNVNGNLIVDISPLKNLVKLDNLNLEKNKIFDLSPLKDLNTQYFYASQQTPEINIATKTFENPIINKDGSKATITPNENVIVNEDGKITIVNFDNLKNGEKVAADFSSAVPNIEFNGKITFIVNKENAPLVEHNITITQIQGANITTEPVDKAKTEDTVIVNVDITDSSKILDNVIVNGQKIDGTSFTMPDEDVNITAKLKDKPVKSYSLRFANKPTGIKSLDTDQSYMVPAGTLVKVEVVMYFPEYYTYTHLNIKNLTTGEVTNIVEPRETINKPYSNALNIAYVHEFVMPESDTEISMHNVEAKIFIEKINGKNATVTTTPEGSQINERPVKINVTDPDNKLISLMVTDGNGNPIALNDENIFIVPFKQHVYIKAIFEEDDVPVTEHNIEIKQIQGATITTTPGEKSVKDTDVKLSINIKDTNKKLDRFIVKDYDGNELEVSDDTFKMPDKDVIVSAILKNIPAPVPQKEYSISMYQGIASKYRAKAGDTVTISTVLPESNFDIWSGDVIFSDLTSKSTTFIMPDRNVSIKAKEKVITEEITEYYDSYSPSSEVRYEKITSVENINLESRFVIDSNEYIKSINGIGTTIKMDVAPFIKDGRTMLSLRFIGEALGFNVSWIEETRTAVLKNKDTIIKVQINSETFTINGKEYKFDSKPIIKNDRTMLSISNLGLALGLARDKNIIWEEATKTVIIKTSVSIPYENEIPIYTSGKLEKESYIKTITKPETIFNENQVLRNQLEDLLSEAENLSLSNTSPESSYTFKKAIMSAKEILTNSQSGVENLKEGVSVLRIAMDNLNNKPIEPEPRPEEPIEESEVREELRGLIKEAQHIDRKLYTEVSLKNLDNAVKKAQSILNDTTLDDDTVDISVEILKLAIMNLVKKDEASLKQFTIIEPHGLLNSPFAFAEMVGNDDIDTNNLQVFVNDVEIDYGRYQPESGFYITKSMQNNKNQILFTAGTFKELGEYKIKLIADGYAAKEFILEMEEFAPVLYFNHGTITTGVDLIVNWYPGNPEDLKSIYMTNDLIVKVNGEKVNYNIPSHKQSFTISKNNFPTNGAYDIVVEREGFEDNHLEINVSDIDSIDIVSSATTEFNVKKEYTVGPGKDGYVNYRFVKTNVTFEDKTTTSLEIFEFDLWGIEITPSHGYVFKDEDVGDFSFIITKNGKELGRKVVTVKPKE